MKALCQGILKSLDKKKTSPSFLQLVGRLSKYDPEKKPCPYHAIILAKRGEIDDTWLNTSREVHAYLIEKSLRDSGHGHKTIRPHSS